MLTVVGSSETDEKETHFTVFTAIGSVYNIKTEEEDHLNKACPAGLKQCFADDESYCTSPTRT